MTIGCLYNGQILNFEKVRFDLEHTLTEQYYLKRVGTTDSELIFVDAVASWFSSRS